MILSRKSFSYKDTVVIEKVWVQLPFRYDALFQDEGCFLFMKEVPTRVTTATSTQNFSANDAILLNCGSYFIDWIHAKNTGAVEIIAIHLPSNVIKELYAHEIPQSILSPKTGQAGVSVTKTEVITKFIESIEFYFDHPSLINDDLLALKIKELILILIQTSNYSTVHDFLSAIYTPNKLNFKKFIQHHTYSSLSVKELATLANMSSSSFNREFRTIFSTSPRDYFLTQKLKKSRELLLVTTLSIAEIAYDSGFDDPAYFSRVFKSKNGITPSEYRQKNNLNKKS